EGPVEALLTCFHHLKQGRRLSRVEEVGGRWAEETGLKGFYVC
ncbi:acylphosphatase, partial [Thermus scotoductus]